MDTTEVTEEVDDQKREGESLTQKEIEVSRVDHFVVKTSWNPNPNP